VWVEAAPGSGKTTLAASWLDSRTRPCLWYQIDAGDADVATFFIVDSLRPAPQ
jgi:ATP/maltotriose-dependent transcriptional regulator MalT